MKERREEYSLFVRIFVGFFKSMNLSEESGVLVIRNTLAVAKFVALSLWKYTSWLVLNTLVAVKFIALSLWKFIIWLKRYKPHCVRFVIFVSGLIRYSLFCVFCVFTAITLPFRLMMGNDVKRVFPLETIFGVFILYFLSQLTGYPNFKDVHPVEVISGKESSVPFKPQAKEKPFDVCEVTFKGWLNRQRMSEKQAISYAKNAHNLVREIPVHILLALAQVESSLGRNVGRPTKNWAADMREVDHRHFRILAKRLGVHVSEIPISRSPGYGYGGAFGVMQFVAKTAASLTGWSAGRYTPSDDFVRNLTKGKCPSNLFNPKDAFVAAALLLKRSKFHYDHSNAIAEYYGGRGWNGSKNSKKIQGYVQLVLTSSKTWESKLKGLRIVADRSH